MKKDDVCEVVCVHEDIVRKVKQRVLDQEKILKLAGIFKALGEPTRLKILHCLKEEEMCVCDISEVLEMSQSAISHQLRVLRDLRIVKYRKEGKNVFYSLDDEHIFKILDEGLNHISHD